MLLSSSLRSAAMAATKRRPIIQRALLSSSTADPFSRYALGSSRWNRLDGDSYRESIIGEAVRQGVTTFEAGQEGGDAALADALRPKLASGHFGENDDSSSPITVVARVGYRSIVPKKNGKKGKDGKEEDDVKLLPGDVLVEKHKKGPTVVHNMDTDYLVEAVASSPLVKLAQEVQDDKLLRVILMLHNPEQQILSVLNEHESTEERQRFIRTKILKALPGLQASVEEGLIQEYGIVSNGLGLPESHPMHLGIDAIMAAREKFKSHHHFTTVELPANLLEVRGWEVAKELRERDPELQIWAMRPLTCYPDLGTGTGYPFGLIDYEIPGETIIGDDDEDVEDVDVEDVEEKKSDDEDEKKDDDEQKKPLDASSVVFDESTTKNNVKNAKLQFTNQMSGPPAIYQIALQTAMSHFDAQELLEAKRERDLTTEERETLDGCKLCQSMLHDLDVGLANVRSFQAYEEELYGRVIPLLYDTFEEFDERTGDVLQAFFASHAVAVRYAIAKRTRQLLTKGGDTSANDRATGRGGCTAQGDRKQNLVKEDDDDDDDNDTKKSSPFAHVPKYEDLPDDMLLQEFALRKLYDSETDDDNKPVFSKIVVGASRPEDMIIDLNIFRKMIIVKGKEEEDDDE